MLRDYKGRLLLFVPAHVRVRAPSVGDLSVLGIEHEVSI